MTSPAITSPASTNPSSPPAFSAARWGAWLRWACVILGCLLSFAALICFFAYNWQDMSRLLKLGSVSLALVTSTLVTLGLGPKARVQPVVSLLTLGLIGGVLAVLGQSYQLGADAYGLFQTWALLAIPLVLASRSQAVFLGWLSVVLLALDLRYLQHPTSLPAWLAHWDLVLLAPLSLAFAVLSLVPAVVSRRPPHAARILTGLAFLVVWLATCFGRMTWQLEPNSLPALVLLSVIMLAALAYQLMRRSAEKPHPTAMFLALVWLAGTAVILAIRLSRWLILDGLGSPELHIFASGLAVVAAFVLAGWGMRAWLEGQQAKSVPHRWSLERWSVDHWAVQGLKSFGGLVGGLALSMGLVGLALLISPSKAALVVFGLLLAVLGFGASWMQRNTQTQGLSLSRLFWFIVIINAWAFVFWGRYEDFGASSNVLIALGFAAAAVVSRSWAPGQALAVAGLAPPLAAWALRHGVALGFVGMAFAAASFATYALIYLRYTSAEQPRSSEHAIPLLWGLSLGTLGLLWFSLWLSQFSLWFGSADWFVQAPWQHSVLGGTKLVLILVATGFALWAARRRYADWPRALPVFVVVLGMAVLLPNLASVALLMAVGGFALGRWPYQILGWLGFGAALVRYYYATGDSLLDKSFALALSAVLVWSLLGLIWLIALMQQPASKAGESV